MNADQLLGEQVFTIRSALPRKYLKKTKPKEKSRLLPIRKFNDEDIGELENTISHVRKTLRGGTHVDVILKSRLTTSNFDYPTRIISPREKRGNNFKETK